MTAPRLSALIVARNEEARLPDCLASVAFADEVVVVLDRSTDASAAIAVAAGARVVEGAWELEGDRRNTGIAACTGDWVLEVDADERVDAALAVAVRETIATSAHAWHLVPVDNYVGNRLVRFGWAGSFGTTSVPRLFRRGAKRWRAQRVHPGLDWTGKQGPKITRGALVHLVDRDISDMLRRLDKYSSAKAADLIAAGDIGTLRANVRRFFSRGFKSYVSRKGYREGGWGVLLALCTGAFPLLSYLKARLEPEKHGGRPPTAKT
jgi:glycosyltransferase involved in cell wall biosynthesis